ncbi:putative Lung seven transmembrane receptor [Medicago truncatula]|uniref:Putative Lung seven transmembrane receptor n=1 Tax=Medicago truncatula TaxID=3880 RepID=A0A396GFT5_MEDTR|nr:putative Lung seven transmembrane receptor [Medicago truncatula]
MIIIKFQILSFFIYLLFLLLFLPNNVHASIHYYSKQPFTHRSNAFFFHAGAEALFSSSFIRFESISFTRPKHSAIIHGQMQQNTGLIESIILEVKDRNRIGGFYFNPKSDLICCDPFLSKTQNCNLGEVIIHNNPQNPNFPKRLKTFFQGTNQIAHMDPQTVQINATGIYYLYFMFCDPNLEGTTFTGRTVWRNPNGYLPGKMQPFITLYAFMSLAYLLLGLAWFLRFLHFWKEKDVVHVHLHYHITAVIALGMVEMAFWYFEYANFNATGSRPMGITIWAVTFTSVKKTLSRLLLLVVSMGYGVVRPTLFEGFVSRVTVLGGFYFVACEVFELFEHLGNINDFSGKSKLLLVLPVTRRNLAKLEIYRKFTNTLAVSVLLSIAWIGFELYFNATDPLSELWQIAWIIPTFWCLLSYTLLLVICVLWAPSRNPTRYAYLEGTNDFDEEGISLTSSVAKMTGDVASKLERKERIGSSATDLTFGDDIEEDKRE